MWHDMSLSFSFICVSCSLLGRAKVYRVLFVFHKTLSILYRRKSPFVRVVWFRASMLHLKIRNEPFIYWKSNWKGVYVYVHTEVKYMRQKVTSMKSFKKSQTCCALVEPWIATLMNVTLHFPFSWTSFFRNNTTYVLKRNTLYVIYFKIEIVTFIYF